MGIPQSNRRRRRTPDTLTGAVDVYDPSDHTVADVLAYVEENPDEANRVLHAELVGKNRVTIITALTPQD